MELLLYLQAVPVVALDQKLLHDVAHLLQVDFSSLVSETLVLSLCCGKGDCSNPRLSELHVNYFVNYLDVQTQIALAELLQVGFLLSDSLSCICCGSVVLVTCQSPCGFDVPHADLF